MLHNVKPCCADALHTWLAGTGGAVFESVLVKGAVCGRSCLCAFGLFKRSLAVAISSGRIGCPVPHTTCCHLALQGSAPTVVTKSCYWTCAISAVYDADMDGRHYIQHGMKVLMLCRGLEYVLYTALLHLQPMYSCWLLQLCTRQSEHMAGKKAQCMAFTH